MRGTKIGDRVCMSQPLLTELMQQAEQLAPDEQLRLAQHLEWLAHRPTPKNRVGHRLQDIRAYRDEILSLAAQHGALNLRVFGSVARGDARPDSDVDFLVECGERLSPWFPVSLIQDLEALLGRRVDVVTQKGLKDRIRDRVLREAIAL